MARLSRIWRSNTVSFASNSKLYESCLCPPLYDRETWTLLGDFETRSRLSRSNSGENFSESPNWNTRPTTGCGARSSILWAHRNPFRQLSRDGNSHDAGMPRATTAFINPSFRAPWRVGEATISRGNAGWTTPKSGRSYPRQNYSQWTPAENAGRGSLLSRSPDEPICR